MGCGFDSEENMQMNNDLGIICSYKGVKKDDRTSVILIEQCKECNLIDIFEDHALKPLIQGAGHIYYSTFISIYF